jgi:hypothetical protein
MYAVGRRRWDWSWYIQRRFGDFGMLMSSRYSEDQNKSKEGQDQEVGFLS